MDFTPSRLVLARKRRGLTKKELAARVGLSVRILTSYESGEKTPSALSLEKVARVLEFPTAFFSGPDLEEPPVGGASFRALSRLPAHKRDQALGAGTLALAIDDWITQRFDRPGTALPQLRGVDPETGAQAVRTKWSLGERPVKNMVKLLELHGVRVFSLAEEYVEVNAFSFWRNGTPYVFLNTMKTAEKSRMDAAHELGHLVLHWGHETPRGRLYEQEAETFASTFLMPRGSVLADAPRGASLDEIIRRKRIWKVSAAALAHRMHGLGLLTEWQYRQVFIGLAQRGFSRSEPNEMPREVSEVLPQVLSAMRTEGVTSAAIAADLGIPQGEFDKLVFGLVMIQMAGGGERSAPSKVPQLTLISEGRPSGPARPSGPVRNAPQR